jgi:hypothetical protein
MARKLPQKPPGLNSFVDTLGKLISVPKGELDAEVAKYDRRKATKKAKAAKAKRPPRRGQ